MSLTYYYKALVAQFVRESDDEILGKIASSSIARQSSIEFTQNQAWTDQILILKDQLRGLEGELYFEFSIPRMGKRVDAIFVHQNLVFVIEFKIGQSKLIKSDIEQVWDYALDLKNFHKTSHDKYLIPILCLSDHKNTDIYNLHLSDLDRDGVAKPLVTNAFDLGELMSSVSNHLPDDRNTEYDWEKGSYQPTPTIIEAATALYNDHTVENITRSDAGATNLTNTSQRVQSIIDESKNQKYKSIIFVTGVPGAGKTLVGLNIATNNMEATTLTHSVYLSGNGPLVDILVEALARDYVEQKKAVGEKVTKTDARRRIRGFVQNVHHYRDEYIKDPTAPSDHVAIFDEAQRAWNKEMTAGFMKRRKGISDFGMSEPQFLVSCLNRHEDWAVVICLVGGGQEINRGEAGISEWIKTIIDFYPDWRVHISDRLFDKEYAAGKSLQLLTNHKYVSKYSDLHLSVSLRSFRSEKLAYWVKSLLDLEIDEAKDSYQDLYNKYPIVVTRDLSSAKEWLRSKARGSERYGIVVSSYAERLKPLAIHVKSTINPVHWFLNNKDDVRSSYFLEDVATEFHVQGLELDWACVTWDADMRIGPNGWKHYNFKGHKWQNIRKEVLQEYQKNAYRVLLTRARQGMVIVVPKGDSNDQTRLPEFYDPIYEMLLESGVKTID